jgi:hypothetical protein
MKNFDIFKNFKNIKIVAISAFTLLLLNSVDVNAQTGKETETIFKVEAPSEASVLQKDTVNNFVSFSPLFVEGKTYVRWMVENDRKDGVFIVERSDDGETFEALGFKDRVGTPQNVKLFYSFIDEEPPVGSAHYRVMQVGVDQTFSYSNSVKVKTGAMPNSTGSALQEGK